MPGVPPLIAFVHIPKTAGLTVAWALRRSFGARHCDAEPWADRLGSFTAKDLRLLLRLYPGLESLSGHRIRAHADLEAVQPEIFYFALVRDPIERCASHFQYLVRIGLARPDFDAWIANERFRDRQTMDLCGRRDASAAIGAIERRLGFVGLFERCDESMLWVARATGGRLDPRYRIRNRPPDDGVKQALLADPGARRKLLDANRLDIEVHRYVAQEYLPRAIARHGDGFEREMAAFREAPHGGVNGRLLLSALKRRLVYRPCLRAYRLLAGSPPGLGAGAVGPSE